MFIRVSSIRGALDPKALTQKGALASRRLSHIFANPSPRVTRRARLPSTAGKKTFSIEKKKPFKQGQISQKFNNSPNAKVNQEFKKKPFTRKFVEPLFEIYVDKTRTKKQQRKNEENTKRRKSCDFPIHIGKY